MTFEATSGPVADVYTGILKAYFNGVLIQTKTDVLYKPASQLRMQYTSSSAYLTGSLDEIYFYDTALTAGDIAQLAAVPESATIGLFGITSVGLLFGRKMLLK